MSWPGQEITEEAWPGQPAPERSTGEQAARLAGNLGAGFNDRLAGVVGAPFDWVNAGLRAVGVPIPEGSVAESIRGGMRSVLGEAPQPENTAERVARGTGQGIADAGSMLVPATSIARAATAGSLTSGVASSAAAMPGLQAASGVAGGVVTENTGNPLLGAGAAIGLPVGAGALARVVTPVPNALSPARLGLVQAAQREGIPLSTGQITGSPVLQNMEASMAQLPGAAGAERAFRQTQAEGFNRAVLRRAGEESDSASPEVLLAARARIGGGIGEIANRNTLDVSPGLQTRLTEIEDGLRFLPANIQGAVRARVENLRGAMVHPEEGVGGSPTIPGGSYRLMDSELGRAARQTGDGDLRAALNDLRQTLRTAMDDSIGPEDADAWRQLRREYANLMVIKDATSGAGAGAAEGNVAPLMLRQALNRSTGGGYAFGQGDLNELARVGQSVLRPVPDSGTAGRTQMNALLTGVGGATGGFSGAAAGYAGAMFGPRMVRAAYTAPWTEAYLRNRLMTPEAMQSIASVRRNAMLQQAERAATD